MCIYAIVMGLNLIPDNLKQLRQIPDLNRRRIAVPPEVYNLADKNLPYKNKR